MVDIVGYITSNWILLAIIFILFVVAIKKTMKILFNALIIVIAAVLFPIFMNKIFDVPFAIDADSILFYVMIGLGAYFIYILAKTVYFALTALEKVGKAAVSPVTGIIKRSEKADMQKMRKFVKEKEKLEKQKKELEKKKVKENKQETKEKPTKEQPEDKEKSKKEHKQEKEDEEDYLEE